jgi:hypothetical protein
MSVGFESRFSDWPAVQVVRTKEKIRVIWVYMPTGSKDEGSSSAHNLKVFDVVHGAAVP